MMDGVAHADPSGTHRATTALFPDQKIFDRWMVLDKARKVRPISIFTEFFRRLIWP
jgi:hypothetical protein